ncbi:MAG: calcium/proton exchanger [Bryobacterales bacterium]|nr:calcium/proton exchanger [Bryobacterales bacterium]
MNWLLVLVPATVAVRYLWPESQTLIFLLACGAVLPLAAWLGHATEHLADRTSEAAGGLLNATFGNAAELIIALVALRAGLYEVVKASITGSIIGNILLVLGAAMVAGGVRHETQRFNVLAARTQTTSLSLAAIALIAPALFHYLAKDVARDRDLSVEISVVLLISYGLSLLFSLHTHKGHLGGGDHGRKHLEDGWSVRKSVAVLLAATGLIAWISEILVGAVEHAADAFGMTPVFVGVIVVAVVGNAAEHSSAIVAAYKNRMDLAVAIAAGSSQQVALFVAPVLVLASYWLAPAPLDLVFTPAEVMAVALSVFILVQVASDGESNWYEGAQLLAVYLILAFVFYLLPAAP